MSDSLTVKEAVQFTGKSESTLKRMQREIVQDPGHADRSLIQPSNDEVERRKAAGEPYAWKIDRELLIRRFPKDEPAQPASAPGQSSSGDGGSTPVMEILRDQLESKDRQIATLETQLDRKDEQIHSLTERMRETNVLMRELQQRLAITAPADNPNSDVVDSAQAKNESAGESPKPKKPAKSQSIWTRPILTGLFSDRKE